MMVEVFKTNVNTVEEAEILLVQIRQQFDGYKANFDLHVRDRILRIATSSTSIDYSAIMGVLHAHGYLIEILEDEPAYPVK